MTRHYFYDCKHVDWHRHYRWEIDLVGEIPTTWHWYKWRRESKTTLQRLLYFWTRLPNEQKVSLLQYYESYVQENNWIETRNGHPLGVDCGSLINELGWNWADLLEGRFNRGWIMFGVVSWNSSTVGQWDWSMDPRVNETWVDGSLISRQVRSYDRWKELDGAMELLVGLEVHG